MTGLSFGDQPFDWMGFSFGDFNHDGNMDFFASNFGDWAREFLGEPYTLHDESSVWFFGQNDNTFVRDQAGLPTTPFGWGTSAEDWDNDGDTDVIFHGGLSLGLAAEASNPGSTLINDGTGMFTYDANATSVDHSRRETAGTAAGDLNGDGYVDIVTVSGEDYPSFTPLVPYNAVGVNRGSVFDPNAFFIPLFAETFFGSGQFVWTGLDGVNGTVSVEINNAESGNGSVTIETLGTVGLTAGSTVNRDGIGAVVFFTPKHGRQAMKPVAGGSSHVSQDSRAQHFGLGTETEGTAEVLWPGGVRNRLYDVASGERVVFPEIPCSFDGDWSNQGEYVACVTNALNDLASAGAVDSNVIGRFVESAVRAFQDEQ